MATQDDPFEHVRKALADWEQRAAPVREQLEKFQADAAEISAVAVKLQDRFKTDELNGAIAEVEARLGVTPEAKAKVAEAQKLREDAEFRARQIIADAARQVEQARAALSHLLVE